MLGTLSVLLLLLDPQTGPHVLVDHVADADGRDDLHEVGQDAAVETEEALLLHDLLHHPVHGHLLGTFHRS